MQGLVHCKPTSSFSWLGEAGEPASHSLSLWQATVERATWEVSAADEVEQHTGQPHAWFSYYLT